LDAFADEGEKKLEELAKLLEKEHPSVAASLREGLSEMFTIKKIDVISLPSCSCEFDSHRPLFLFLLHNMLIRQTITTFPHFMIGNKKHLFLPSWRQMGIHETSIKMAHFWKIRKNVIVPKPGKS
jgi:hypothetical protein